MSKKRLIKNPAWTDKVAPATAQFIKLFIDMIRYLDEPTEEDAETSVESITVGKIRSFKPFYERDRTVKILVDVFQPF